MGMNVREHKQRGDKKVWLSQDELELLVEHAGGIEQEIAFGLGGRCGLRSHEVLNVAPEHVQDTDAGLMLVIEHGKGDKYRETPIPRELANTIRTANEYRDEGPGQSILSITATRTLRRWINRAADRCEEQTGDHRWQYLSFHDLRATWATALRSEDVDAMVVCDWGGWNDLDTFLEHYRGTHTPEAQRREREKVGWLN